MKNIVLTGLSGSGKTTLGHLLADALGMTFVDMDDLVVQQAGMEIKDIFAKYGEKHFRDIETRVAHQVSAMTGMVIATGGGAVLRSENVGALRATGRIIFLDRSPARIVEDLECGARPLLAEGAEKLYEMSRQRHSLYLAAADDVYSNTGTVQDAMRSLLPLIRAERTEAGYVVIGDPIDHTLSPPTHNAVFAALGLPANYTARFVKRGEVGAFVRQARAEGTKGFNITAPHKADVIPYLDEVEEEALLCGAVNTVVARNGRLYGYNTDMQGLLMSVQDHGADYQGSRIVILGTGGAAAGVALKAAREGAREIAILGRRPEAAGEIARRLQDVPGVGAISAGGMGEAELENAMRGCDILINCIPLGMTGAAEDCRPLDFLKALPKHALVCDMIYSPPRTALLQEAEAIGLQVINGLAMLIYQAILADEHYLGRTLDKQAMYQTVAKALALHDQIKRTV